MKAELFDRYVHEVGRRLPKKQRADVEAELHSLLMDALQDRMEGRAEEASAEDQVAVLEAFGPPSEVAARYAPPHRYLIGPGILNIYLIVVAAVGGALTIAYIVLLGLTAWSASASAIGTAIGELASGYVNALLTAFGSVTLTFAVLERLVPASAWEKTTEKAWDPRSLPPVEDTERIERGGLIASSVFLVIALVVFNLFPQWIGIGFVRSADDGVAGLRFWPVLAPVFFTAYLPWLNGIWLVQLVLNVVLLRQGRWQLVTRLVDLLLSIGGIVLIGQMLVGPSLIAVPQGVPAELHDLLTMLLPNAVRLALIVALIATAGEGIAKLVRLIRGHVLRQETIAA
jgi:hypothetical protein